MEYRISGWVFRDCTKIVIMLVLVQICGDKNVNYVSYETRTVAFHLHIATSLGVNLNLLFVRAPESCSGTGVRSITNRTQGPLRIAIQSDNCKLYVLARPLGRLAPSRHLPSRFRLLVHGALHGGPRPNNRLWGHKGDRRCLSLQF